MATNDLIFRYQYASYMKCVLGDEKYHLIGEGFTSFPESKNPSEYSRKYISDKTERSDVIGYSPRIEYSCDVITDEPVVNEIVKVTDQELLGTDTHRDIVNVNLWNEVSDGEYEAYLRTYAIIPDGRGDGTDTLIYTGTLKACSDQTAGTFNIETLEFTPSASDTATASVKADDAQG